MKKLFKLFIIFGLLAGASAHAKISSKELSLIKASETGDQAKVTALLKDKKINLNAQDEVGMTALMSAALGGHVDILKQLVSKKVSLETKNQSGDTALAVAVTNDQFAAAKALIKAGANVDVTVAGEEGDTLFMRSLGDIETAKLILQKNKALINKTNKLGETALIQSIRFGNIEAVKLLISQGADSKIKTKDGQTALDIAKSLDNKEAVRLLSSK
ncbi:ankyrin repeat domain-containing protein [Bdellovibrio bacteriovorus]|uniref:ankyrin repeat domain-containing protein n=1 Tax=Bdellovibrio bacteriovorus TaxID=959 RepID=UPI0035A5F084